MPKVIEKKQPDTSDGFFTEPQILAQRQKDQDEANAAAQASSDHRKSPNRA